MKGIAPIFVLVAFILIMGGLGLYATANGTTFQAAVASIFNQAASLTGISGNYILQPMYGTYSCLPKSQIINSNIVGVYHAPDSMFLNDYSLIVVKVSGNTPNANIGYRAACHALFGCTTDIDYRYCNVNGNCDSWQHTRISLGNTDDRITYFSRQFIQGESAEIKVFRYNDAKPDGVAPVWGAIQYTPYQLVQRAANGYTAVANTDGCQVPILKNAIGDDKIPPEVCVSGCQYNKVGDRLQFDQYENYLGGYTLAPSEQAVSYNNENYYCQPVGTNVQLQKLKTITTERTTYYIPDPSNSITKECCPFQTLAGYVCTDFKWVYKGGADMCDMFGTVASCSGNGNWFLDYSDPAQKTIKRATGCTALKNCIYTTQQVECTTSAQCSSNKPICKNYICITSQITPQPPACGNAICEPAAGENTKGASTYCEADCGTVAKCGNKLCEQGESPANCPLDCVKPTDWLSIIINFVMLLAVGTVIGAVILAIVGFLVPFIGVMILRNWRIFLLTSLAFGLLLALFFTPFTASVASMVL